VSNPQGVAVAPPARSRFGGLAWTAVVLGIVGLVGSPIIILNNVTAVAAGVGVVLGVVALFGTRKVLAAIGVVLCVAGIVVTVVVQNAAVKSLDTAINGTTNQGQVSGAGGGAGGSAGGGAGKTGGTPTWGARYTWQSGLAIEVSAPSACTPGQYASPQNVARAVKFTITVVNGSKQSVDAAQLTTMGEAQFDGHSADPVFDSQGSCGDGGMQTATILPGKSFTYTEAYSVGAQPGDLQLVFQPDFGSDKAVYTGKA
jgi:hypothetical protein